MNKGRTSKKPLSRQWEFLEYDALGEEQFTRLCLLLLKEEISIEVQPTNKKGRDYTHDAFLLPCQNKYKREGLWWFQFKFRDFGRAINSGRNQNLKDEFKRDFESELQKIVQKNRVPQNYIIITNVELTGGDFANWFSEEIITTYSSKIPFIRCWDYSQLNVLLDQYPAVKRRFEDIISGTLVTPEFPKRTAKKTKGKGKLHLLSNPESRFVEKLSYILDLIENLQKPREQERNQSLEIISKDSTLAWHFLRNLKNINWFPKIKNGLIKSVIKQEQDTAVKYQLLHYFELCAERYSNEIIPLLIELENNTTNPNILLTWIRTLSKLKPGKKTKLDSIWKILNKLAEHQHPWVRKEIPDTLKILAEYDLDKSLKILKKLFLSSPIPRNVTQGSPTLALTFQGADNENWVFEQSARVFADLMADPRYTEKVMKLACELEIAFIKQEKERKETAGGIILDYSHIWLGDRDPLNRLEYEYNRKKRVALELEKFLMNIAPNEIARTRKTLSQLLQNEYEVFYLISINVLIQNTRGYLPTAESVVFNKGLWGNYHIQNYFLQRLIQNYFELDQSRLNEFMEAVLAMSDDEEKEKDAYFKQDLLISIPERFRTKEVNDALSNLERKLRVPAKIEPIFQITSWSGPQPDTTTKELKLKTPDELVDIMEEASTRKRKADPYDLAPLFAELVRENPDLIHQLLERLSSRNIAPDFLAHMVRVYIEVKNKNWEEILNVFWKLNKKQGWARMEIARFLERKCREESIKSIDSDLLNKIKQALFDLAEDEDPNDDGTMRSSHPSPEDAITRGINSIRGVATEALVVLLFYYPDDSDIEKKVKAFAEDKTITIKATLLYNLRCLTGKKYDFCDAIVKKFIDIRKPEIDFALIHYFASLDPKKFKSNESFIKLIFSDPHEKIQSLLGELIGGRYLSNFPIKPLLDSIIKGAIGEVDARRSIAFIFESNLETIIGTNKQRQVLDYIKQLADPQREPDHSIRERSTFFFVRSGTKPEHFMVFYKSHIFDAIIKDAINISSQNHLIEYLERCIYINQSIEKCLEVLHRQTTTVEGVWTDQLIVQRIAAILRKLYENSNLKKNLKKKVDEIFDKGLQRGWDEFYKLFEDFKANRSNS